MSNKPDLDRLIELLEAMVARPQAPVVVNLHIGPPPMEEPKKKKRSGDDVLNDWARTPWPG